MSNIPFRSAKQLAAMMRQKKIGCLELLDHYLNRIDQYNSKLNAIIFMDVDAARKRAKAADRAIKKGEVWGPLHGVPMTIKESYNVVGMPTTWGIPKFKKNYPKENAITVNRLLNAGVVLFGKTNVPYALADWQSFNAIYGTTNNPWDVTRTPGGSSGGSGAALAAGLTGIEAGSDIGSSIRNPAHYCGVYGHKPTYGVVTPKGQALPGVVATTDISVVGPLTRSADDLAIGLDVMAGPDDIDGIGWQLKLPKSKKKKLSEFKVGIIYTDKEAEVDEAVQKCLRDVARFLRKNKVTVKVNARPNIDSGEAYRNYIQLLRAATSKRMTPKEFKNNLKAFAKLSSRAKGYEAQAIRAQAMYHRDWLLLNEERHHLRLAWADYFKKYDLLLCPVATTTAFPHNQKGERWDRMITVNGKPQPSTTQMFWAGYSCNFYLPSTIAPVGLAKDGLPVGLQIIGPQYGDYTCIQFAQLLEREYQGFIQPTGYE